MSSAEGPQANCVVGPRVKTVYLSGYLLVVSAEGPQANCVVSGASRENRILRARVRDEGEDGREGKGGMEGWGPRGPGEFVHVGRLPV